MTQLSSFSCDEKLYGSSPALYKIAVLAATSTYIAPIQPFELSVWVLQLVVASS